MNLKETLIKEDRTRWLDVGSGGNLESGFHYLDTYPTGIISRRFRDRYFRVDLLNASESVLAKLGSFDFIRMQHVFEHFTQEDGLNILRKCAPLLNSGGTLLITVPSLKVHIKKYMGGDYRTDKGGFKDWATQRIPEDAPDSFYFSIFAHSMIGESHKWCYDFEGLRFQLERAGQFTDIQELTIDSPLSSIPFTHNRPEEDVCVIARKVEMSLAAAPQIGEIRELATPPSGQRVSSFRRILLNPAYLQLVRVKDRLLRPAVRRVRSLLFGA